jgi:endonuclease YncB( thermonuclease family)
MPQRRQRSKLAGAASDLTFAARFRGKGEQTSNPRHEARHAVFPFDGTGFSWDDARMANLPGDAEKLLAHRALPMLAVIALAIAPVSALRAAAPCAFADQGEGRVTEIVDGRSFRLDDGREIKLAGIETAISDAHQDAGDALAALIENRDVTLRGDDDAPDRYGRQRAFVTLTGSDTLVQREMLAQGEALAAADIADKDCAGLLTAAETEARTAHRGIWGSAVIKNAESPDDILSGIGRFTVVEGKVLSVRQAGAITYLNFGHNWTRGFAVTISRRMTPVLEAAGLAAKSLENRRIRVRGWVEAQRGVNSGPRIDVLQVAQIEILNSN